MRSETRPSVPERMEARLDAACPACGGPLEVRIEGASAGSYCRACRLISRPFLRRHDQEVVLVHAPAGLA